MHLTVHTISAAFRRPAGSVYIRPPAMIALSYTAAGHDSHRWMPMLHLKKSELLSMLQLTTSLAGPHLCTWHRQQCYGAKDCVGGCACTLTPCKSQVHSYIVAQLLLFRIRSSNSLLTGTHGTHRVLAEYTQPTLLGMQPTCEHTA